MNKFSLYTGACFVIIIGLSSFTYYSNTMVHVQDDGFVIPDNINTIFGSSCVECHVANASNGKAKMKFRIDKLTTLKRSKLIAKLGKIAREVEKGDMPPKKFVAKNPGVPTEDEKKILIAWARKVQAELAGE